MYVCVYVCMYVCVCICMYVYMYMYICISPLWTNIFYFDTVIMSFSFFVFTHMLHFFPSLCIPPCHTYYYIHEKMNAKYTCVYRTLTDCSSWSMFTGRVSFELMHLIPRCYSCVEYMFLSYINYEYG